MAAVPVFPVFGYQQAATIAQLNDLAYDVSFLLAPPGQVLLTSAAAQSIPDATLTAITWSTAASAGADTMWTAGSQCTAQTPGYYDLDAQVSFAGSAAGAQQVMFRVTTGSGNPAGPGATTIFGQLSASAAGATLCTGMLSPYMYAGDYAEVLAWQDSGSAVDTAAPWCLLAVCLTSLGP